MTIHDYVQNVIEQIRGGIKSFNDGDRSHSAVMPSEITFTIKSVGERIANKDDRPESIHEMQFTISINTYRSDKSNYSR